MVILADQTPLLLADVSARASPPPTLMSIRSLEAAPDPFTFRLVPGGPMLWSKLTPAPIVSRAEGGLLLLALLEAVIL